MKRLNQMIGLPVMCGERRLGFVSSLCLSTDAHDLTGLNMRRGLHASMFIPASCIHVMEDTRVEVAAGQRERARKALRLGPACDGEGMRLGVVSDAAIDERTLRVKALELTFGPVDDLLRGRRWIRRFTVDPATGEVIVSLEEDDGCKHERGKPS